MGSVEAKGNLWKLPECNFYSPDALSNAPDAASAHVHNNTMIILLICTIIIQIPYRLFESYVHHVATINIPPKMAASSVISVKLCWWTVCGCKYIANKSYHSKTNSDWGTFNMFNIIKTPRNYFTCELLHNNLSSNVALQFNVSHWRPYLVVSCSEEVFCQPSTAPADNTHIHTSKTELKKAKWTAGFRYNCRKLDVAA